MPAIEPHKTEISSGPWDGPANEARLRSGESPSYYARAYAWRDPEKDPATKGAYKFPHHEVDPDGNIGPANVTACRAIIAALNGARGGADIPEGDREGVYRHAARHLRDADVEPPPLKSVEEIVLDGDDVLVAFGTEVKSLGGGRFGGYVVRFTGPDMPDLDGEYFDASTDFGVESGDPANAYYNHGVDLKMGKRRIGRGTLTVHDDVGIWIEAQLHMRDEYERAIAKLAESGMLGWSSGSLPHLVEKRRVGNTVHITRWPIGEVSMTPTPAAGPILTRVTPLKTWKQATRHLFELLPEVPDDNGTADENNGGPSDINTVKTENATTMNQNDERDGAQLAGNGRKNTNSAPGVIVERDPEEVRRAQEERLRESIRTEVVADLDARFEELKARFGDFDTLSQRINALLDHAEAMPSKRKAGWLTDGGKDHQEVKSFADFLMSIRRGDVERLVRVYKSFPDRMDATKDMSGMSGPAGGFLVPEEFVNELLRVDPQTAPILSRVQRVPVNSRTGEYPALDQWMVPNPGVGETPFAAGIRTSILGEGDTFTETQPEFGMIVYNLHKVGGATEVPNELLNDSPMAVEALLRGLFAMAVNARTEYAILMGTGVGQPTGILNSPAVVNVTPAVNNTFTWTDVATMTSRLMPMNGAQPPVWVIHPSIWPDILTMDLAGVAVWTANMQSGAGNTINGYQIVQSHHLPQADNRGAVILASLSAYILFVRDGLTIAFSEHAGFLKDTSVWRFSQRLDGMPWVKAPYTLPDPQGGYTVSPFVVHND